MPIWPIWLLFLSCFQPLNLHFDTFFVSKFRIAAWTPQCGHTVWGIRGESSPLNPHFDTFFVWNLQSAEGVCKMSWSSMTVKCGSVRAWSLLFVALNAAYVNANKANHARHEMSLLPVLVSLCDKLVGLWRRTEEPFGGGTLRHQTLWRHWVPFFCRSQGVVHQMCGGFVGAGQPIRANFAGPIPRRKQAVSSGHSTALAIRSGATCAVIDLAVLLVWQKEKTLAKTAERHQEFH